MTQLPLDIHLVEFHKLNGAKIIPFAGYNMPINYKNGIINEHKSVRSTSGIFDVSHMGQIFIPNNKSNINNLEKYIPLNLNSLQLNKSHYSFLLNDKGGIIDDLILSNISFENNIFFYIVYNASRKKIDEDIFLNCASDSEILINNCLFAVQGPASFKVLSALIKIPNNMKFLDIHSSNYKNSNILISRTGYTGEDGFEISAPFEIAEDFMRELLNHDKTTLCGLGARDSLRLEAGLSLYGHELNEQITPIDAGLSWAIDESRFKDKKLNGVSVLINQMNSNPKKIKIGIIATNRSMIRDGMKLFDEKKNNIGVVTSGCFSPSLNKSIGIAYVQSNLDLNEKIYCNIRNTFELVINSKLPFVKKNYKKNGENYES